MCSSSSNICFNNTKAVLTAAILSFRMCCFIGENSNNNNNNNIINNRTTTTNQLFKVASVADMGIKLNSFCQPICSQPGQDRERVERTAD